MYSSSAQTFVTVTDAAVVRGVAQCDADCLNELYGRYAGAVFSLACRIGRDRALAEEATQDVFVQVWRDASTYDEDRGTVRAWMLTIARARALDRLRAQQVRTGRAAPLEDAERSDVRSGQASSPETSAAASEDTAMIDTVLAVLPDADRHLIELAYFKGMTHAEIAAVLGQPLGTIKTHMRRVLRVLRAAIGAHTRPPFAWHPRPGDIRAATAPERSSLRSLTILVVDDDADTLKLLTLVLIRAGATVVPASSAAQALKRLDAAWPDVLLTDLEMPDQDGYALLEQVRNLADARGSRLPAVAFTAHGADRDRSRTSRAGFNLHLAKPVRPSVLVAQVAELVRPADQQSTNLPGRVAAAASPV